jgi:hypothetical protein
MRLNNFLIFTPSNDYYISSPQNSSITSASFLDVEIGGITILYCKSAFGGKKLTLRINLSQVDMEQAEKIK